MCCLVVLSFMASAQGTEKVLVEEVKINVSALSADGHFVPDLRKEDLVISENGRLQQANVVRRMPANVLIMLDTGGTMMGNLSESLSAAQTLIASLGEGDGVAVFQIGDKPKVISDWTIDKAAASESIRKKLTFGRRTALYLALREARGFFPAQRVENRHLVLITAGIDSFNDDAARKAAIADLLSTDINVHVISYTHIEKGSVSQQKEVFRPGQWKPKRLPEEIVETLPDPKRPGAREADREVTPRDMAKIPRLSGVSLDLDRLANARKRSKELDSAETFLESLALDTNGIFLMPEAVDEMNAKSAALAEVIDSQWVVSYTPKIAFAEAPRGDVRNLEVTSRRAGVQVNARRKLIANVVDNP
jgi:VWFA-related protein